jgi:GR25 family glycosyltransferase involved in LPS biosynthesis
MDSPAPSLTVFCINLANRVDRWADFTAAFAPLKDIVSYERFDALRGETGVDGCRASHLAVIAEAKRRGLPWVGIMEDDCQPYDHFASVYPNILTTLWRQRGAWDIYNSGPVGLRSVMHLEYPIMKIDTCACAQFVIIPAHAYDVMLAHGASVTYAIDTLYEKYRVVTSVPPLTYQRPSISDINKGEMGGIREMFDRAAKYISMFKPIMLR